MNQYQNIHRLDDGYVSPWEINFVSSISKVGQTGLKGDMEPKGATIWHKAEAG